MAKKHVRLVQLEDVPETGLSPTREQHRYVPLSHFAGELDHKGETMESGEVGFIYPPWMQFIGNWSAETLYFENDVVVDGCYTMIANKETNDRPAPQPIGDGAFQMPDTLAWTENNATAVVYSGHEYVFNQPGWVQAVRVWIPSVTGSTNYRFVLLNITNPAAPIVTVIEEPVLVPNSWNTIALGVQGVVSGTTWRLFIDALDSGGSTIVTGGWTNGGSDNNNNPPAQSWNKTTQNTLIRIDKTDLDSVNRETELLGVIAGSTIQIADTAQPLNSALYEVTAAPVDGGSSVNYTVNLISTNGGGPTVGQANTITIDVPIPQQTSYVQFPGFWLTNPTPYATVTGLLQFDGVDQPGVADDGFGVDFYFQPASISDDWDLVSYNCGSGGGGGGGDFPEAPNDGLMYGRRNQAWQNTVSGDVNNALVQGSDGGLFVPISGGGSDGNGIFDFANDNAGLAVTNTVFNGNWQWDMSNGNRVVTLLSNYNQGVLRIKNIGAGTQGGFRMENDTSWWDMRLSSGGNWQWRQEGDTRVNFVSDGGVPVGIQMQLQSDGAVRLNKYGAGSYVDNAPAYMTGFTGAGGMVEVELSAIQGIDIYDFSVLQMPGATGISAGTGFSITNNSPVSGSGRIGHKWDEFTTDTPDNATDYLVFWDSSAFLCKKILIDDLSTGGGIYGPSNSLSINHVADLNNLTLTFTDDTLGDVFLNLTTRDSFGSWTGIRFGQDVDDANYFQSGEIRFRRPILQQQNGEFAIRLNGGSAIEDVITGTSTGAIVTRTLNQSVETPQSTNYTWLVGNPNVIEMQAPDATTIDLNLTDVANVVDSVVLYVVNRTGGTGTVEIKPSTGNAINNVINGTVTLSANQRAMIFKVTNGWFTIVQ